jgi:hypothetical protein
MPFGGYYECAHYQMYGRKAVEAGLPGCPTPLTNPFIPKAQRPDPTPVSAGGKTGIPKPAAEPPPAAAGGGGGATIPPPPPPPSSYPPTLEDIRRRGGDYVTNIGATAKELCDAFGFPLPENPGWRSQGSLDGNRTASENWYRELASRFKKIMAQREVEEVCQAEMKAFLQSIASLPTWQEKAKAYRQFIHRSTSVGVATTPEGCELLAKAGANYSRLCAQWRAEEAAATMRRVCEANRARKISALAEKERLTSQEAEAVLAYVNPKGGYQKNTLTALQVINRYASACGIRPEDAIVVLREYA